MSALPCGRPSVSPQLSQAAAHLTSCRRRAKWKIQLNQMVVGMGAGGAPANSFPRNHPPGKSFLPAAAWQDSVNHSEPNVTTEGTKGSRGAVWRQTRDVEQGTKDRWRRSLRRWR